MTERLSFTRARAPLMRVLLFAALLVGAAALSPVASARAPEDGAYREQAEAILGELDSIVLKARTATVEHAFGDRDARSTAHAMRVLGERVDVLAHELEGLVPPRGHARAHAALEGALAWYGESLAFLQSCFRGSDKACDDATVRLGFAAVYLDVAAEAFGVRAFS